uniref:Uncharacterized protein n=1 Tax=Medicago truncatula TaxID=3880 RepID=Q2HU85_MEDTR|nr:hypothetical protein MtrDRAFT_AC149208g37v2 [Medicago truncatula]
MQAALINVFNVIWQARNAARFNNRWIPWKSAIANIISSVYTSARNSFLAASSSMVEFSIFKAFNCKLTP